MFKPIYPWRIKKREKPTRRYILQMLKGPRPQPMKGWWLDIDLKKNIRVWSQDRLYKTKNEAHNDAIFIYNFDTKRQIQ